MSPPTSVSRPTFIGSVKACHDGQSNHPPSSDPGRATCSSMGQIWPGQAGCHPRFDSEHLINPAEVVEHGIQRANLFRFIALSLFRTGGLRSAGLSNEFSRKILLQSKPHSNDSSGNRVYYQRGAQFRARNQIKNASITVLRTPGPWRPASDGPVRYSSEETALRVIDNDFPPGLS